MFISVPEEEDNSDLEGAPPVGVLRGTVDTAAHDLQFGTTSELIGMAHDGISPGKVLTHEDYEDSQWKRPGISFPKGVSEARAKRSADRFDANQKYNFEMSGISNGFLSTTSKLVGGTLGFLADPLNLAASGLAIASAGTLSEPLLAAAAEYGITASLGARFATNALIALSSMAPQSATDFAAGTIYGEDPSVLSALSSLAINSCLGGLIGTVASKPIFGALKRIIPSSEHFVALKSAVSQLEGGKRVKVDDILQNAAYQQEGIDRVAKTQFTPEELAKNQEVNRQLIVDDLENRKVEVDKLEGHEELKSQIDSQLNLLKNGEPSDEIKLDLPELPEELKRDRLSPKQLIDGDYDEARIRGAQTDEEKLVTDSWNQLTDNVVTVVMPEMSKGPVNLGQVKGTEADLKSEKSDNIYDPQEQLQYDRETEQAKQDTQIGTFSDNEVDLKEPTDLEDLKKETKALAEHLPEEMQEHLDNIEDIEKDHNTIADAMEKYSDCINGV